MIPHTNISLSYAFPLFAWLLGGWLFVWTLCRTAAKPGPRRDYERR